MTRIHRRPVAVILGFASCLLLDLACKRPGTALREQPIQRVDLIQKVQGMTPLEEQELITQIAEGLGLPKDPPSPPVGTIRIFRLTLEGRPNASTGHGPGKALLVSTGLGTLMGAILPLYFGASGVTWKSVAMAAGLGGIAGFAYGPIWYQNNQTTLKAQGYLPWQFTARWIILARTPGRADDLIASSDRFTLYASSNPTLNLKPYLRPLPPETRTEADIRRASLKAFAQALVHDLQTKP